MYTSVQRSEGTFFVRMSSLGRGATKAFSHGRISFDPAEKTIQFSRHTPIPFPDFAETVKKDAILTFRLLAPDGTAHLQKREVKLLEGKDGQLFAPGISKTPSNHPKVDGWRARVLKFRAYFTHPGVETEPGVTPHLVELPRWLQDSINRQRRFRARLVQLCLEARDACRPVNDQDLARFVKEAVLPAVDDFNKSLGRSKDKISAKRLRVEMPSIFFLSRFGSFLRYLEKQGKPVPAGLAERISAFTKDLTLDFTPIARFEREFDSIVRRERYLEDLSLIEQRDENGALRVHKVYRRLTDPGEIESRRSELELRDWEWKPVAAAFKTSLKRRKTLRLPFYEGWPKVSDDDSSKWGIHFYFNNGGSDASLLTGKGVRGLRLGPAIPSDLSGRKWKADSRRARRHLNPVEIGFHDTLADERFTFKFVVLRHQFPIPDGSLIKEWKIVHNRSGLWLCFVVVGRFAKPTARNGEIGAVHLGWRKEGAESWPAIIFDPTCGGSESFHRVILDTELPPEKSHQHTPFRINMGPSRKGRRSPYWIKASKPHLRTEPGAAGAVQIQDTWEGIERLAQWRDDRKDIFKALLLDHLEPAPDGLHRAGVRILRQIGETLEDPLLVQAYQAWKEEDQEIGDLITEFSSRVAARLSDGYSRVAHDICRVFSKRGVSSIAIQDSVLSSVAKRKKSSRAEADNSAVLKNSQANRHRLAPGQLLTKLSTVAEKYGINVIKVPSANISRVHYRRDSECNHINRPSAERLIRCEKCGEIYDQDENACMNMVLDARRRSSLGHEGA